MHNPWRVGILGLGHWYSAYGLARALPEYPKAELVAVAWHDRAQREAFAHAFHVDAYAEYEALLARRDIDIVHIATPVSEIPGCTRLAAQAGKHLILGKPMAMSVAQADEMVAAVEAAGIVCFPFQGIARLRMADVKARIEAGEIGALVLLHQAARWSIAEDWYRSGTPGWFADPRHVPGGAFIDEGIYWVDLFRWLAGSEVAQVEARMANLVHRDLPVEDWGQATFTFANGILATLEASWTISAPRRTGPSPKQNSVVRLEAIGTRGELIDQWFRVPERTVLAAGAADWTFERHAEEPFAPATPAALAHLIDCLETGRPPVATIRDARAALATCLAAYAAASRREPVSLSW